MRGLLLSVMVLAGAWTADARGQFGLYGAPEIINLPPTQASAMPGADAPIRPVYAPPAYPMTRQTGPPAAYVQPAGAYGAEYPADLPESEPGVAAFAGPPRGGRPAAPPRGAPGRAPPPDAPDVPGPPAPGPVPAPSLVDQMLEAPTGRGALGAYGTDQGPMGRALSGAPCASDCGAPCAPDCAPCAAPEGYCPWYASASVLFMGRDEPNRFWSSYERDNEPNQMLHTNDIHLKWRAGGEVRFGRRFCCGTWAVEAAYFTLEPLSGMASVTHPNGVSTPIDLRQVWFYRNAADWNMAEDLFDSALEHRLWRRNEVHSVEINFLRTGMLCDPQHALDVNWGLGVRWFRFDEDLVFGSLRAGTWGAAGGVNEAYIDENLVNDLVGAQLTLDVSYYVRPNWRVFVTPRVGLYNNHIQQNFQVYRGDGTVARPQPGTGVPGAYPVRCSTDTLSFLTQVDLGVDWRFTRAWSAGVGYRVIVATGMGLAENQIPQYLIDLPEVAHIKHNGHLVLHGAFASLTYNF